LDQFLILSHSFAQVEQIFRSNEVVRPSSRDGQICCHQFPDTFPDAEVEGVIVALVLHKIVRAVFTRMVTFQIVGREIVQARAQRMMFVTALFYVKFVIPHALADAERVQRLLQMKIQSVKQNRQKLVSIRFGTRAKILILLIIVGETERYDEHLRLFMKISVIRLSVKAIADRFSDQISFSDAIRESNITREIKDFIPGLTLSSLLSIHLFPMPKL